jgi:hypothetical protein
MDYWRGGGHRSSSRVGDEEMTLVEVYELFDNEKEPFVQAAPHARDVQLVVHRKHYLKRPSKRDVAWYEPATRTINITKRVLAFQPPQIKALIRHEFGHVLDENGSEQRADDLAEWVTGEPIYYDRDDIQTLEMGTHPRPLHLPQ